MTLETFRFDEPIPAVKLNIANIYDDPAARAIFAAGRASANTADLHDVGLYDSGATVKPAHRLKEHMNDIAQNNDGVDDHDRRAGRAPHRHRTTDVAQSGKNEDQSQLRYDPNEEGYVPTAYKGRYPGDDDATADIHAGKHEGEYKGVVGRDGYRAFIDQDPESYRMNPDGTYAGLGEATPVNSPENANSYFNQTGTEEGHASFFHDLMKEEGSALNFMVHPTIDNGKDWGNRLGRVLGHIGDWFSPAAHDDTTGGGGF